MADTTTMSIQDLEEELERRKKQAEAAEVQRKVDQVYEYFQRRSECELLGRCHPSSDHYGQAVIKVKIENAFTGRDHFGICTQQSVSHAAAEAIKEVMDQGFRKSFQSYDRSLGALMRGVVRAYFDLIQDDPWFVAMLCAHTLTAYGMLRNHRDPLKFDLRIYDEMHQSAIDTLVKKYSKKDLEVALRGKGHRDYGMVELAAKLMEEALPLAEDTTESRKRKLKEMPTEIVRKIAAQADKGIDVADWKSVLLPLVEAFQFQAATQSDTEETV